MKATSLVQALKEPITKKVALLVVLLLAAMGSMVVQSRSRSGHRLLCEKLVRNQHAKRTLGNILQKNVLQIETEVPLLATARDEKRVQYHQDQILSHIRSIERLLGILSNGGEYEHVIPTNFENTDEFRERIRYEKQDEGIVIEVIELVPKLADLQREIDLLAAAVRQRIRAGVDRARGALNDPVAFHRKEAEATLLRSRESANKIYLDTSQRLASIEETSRRRTARLRQVELLVTIILGVLCALATGVMLLQIVHILEERRDMLSDLRTHRDRLDELVRKRTHELEALTRRNALILESAGEGIYGLDRDGNTTFVNAAAAQMLGWQTDELLGRGHHDLVHRTQADGRPHSQQECPVCATLKDGVTRRVPDDVFWRKDGTSFPVNYICTPILESDEIVGAVVTYQDVTQARESDAKLRQSEEFTRTVVESIGVGVVVIDAETHTILQANSAALEMAGRTGEDVVGRACHRFLCPSEQGRCPITDLGQTVDLTERELLSANGESIPVLKNVAAVTKNGRRHLIESFTDIRDLKATQQRLRQHATLLETKNMELESHWQQLKAQQQALRAINQELEAATAAARAANQAKSQFLANMSHEIRTPMTAILGFGETLLETDLTDAERTVAVNAILRSGRHLLEIINDILDVSRIEAGRLRTERVAFSPLGLTEEVRTMTQVRAEEKGLSFDCEYPDRLPEVIRTDPIRLRQILINLVGNAIKFTETGGVKLVTRFLPVPPDGHEGASGPVMQFDVVDSGIGIDPDQVGGLFEPFKQVDSSTTRKFGGTGLGLAISRRLAIALGGDITVESTPGRGSTFTVTISAGRADDLRLVEVPRPGLPQEQRDEPVVEDDAVAGRLNGRVLLAEDGPDNQRLIAYVLRRAGATVELAENGQIAVDKALAACAQRTPFDVILMDIQMPVLDGCAATRRLRQQGYTGSIIALTAHAMVGDREKCLQAGCDDFATKPINRAELIARIAARIDPRATAEGPA